MIVDSVPVFVKEGAVDRSRAAPAQRKASTVNLFDLPMSLSSTGSSSTRVRRLAKENDRRCAFRHCQWILENPNFHPGRQCAYPLARCCRSPRRRGSREELQRGRRAVGRRSPAVAKAKVDRDPARRPPAWSCCSASTFRTRWTRLAARAGVARPDPVAAYAMIETEVLGAVRLH